VAALLLRAGLIWPPGVPVRAVLVPLPPAVLPRVMLPLPLAVLLCVMRALEDEAAAEFARTVGQQDRLRLMAHLRAYPAAWLAAAAAAAAAVPAVPAVSAARCAAPPAVPLAVAAAWQADLLAKRKYLAPLEMLRHRRCCVGGAAVADPLVLIALTTGQPG